MTRRFRDPSKPPDTRTWFIYVIQSLEVRFGKTGKQLPGFHYVGASTDPLRRLREHNGEVVGGGKYTAKHRPWKMMAIFGPYCGQSEAMKAERALKHGKRGKDRVLWSPADSPLCRGLGPNHPDVLSAHECKDQPWHA